MTVSATAHVPHAIGARDTELKDKLPQHTMTELFYALYYGDSASFVLDLTAHHGEEIARRICPSYANTIRALCQLQNVGDLTQQHLNEIVSKAASLKNTSYKPVELGRHMMKVVGEARPLDLTTASMQMMFDYPADRELLLKLIKTRFDDIPCDALAMFAKSLPDEYREIRENIVWNLFQRTECSPKIVKAQEIVLDLLPLMPPETLGRFLTIAVSAGSWETLYLFSTKTDLKQIPAEQLGMMLHTLATRYASESIGTIATDITVPREKFSGLIACLLKTGKISPVFLQSVVDAVACFPHQVKGPYREGIELLREAL